MRGFLRYTDDIAIDEDFWTPFVDVFASALFVLLLFVIVARFSENLLMMEQRKKIQEMIRKDLSSLNLSSATIECEKPTGNAKYRIYLLADEFFPLGSAEIKNPEDMKILGLTLKKYISNEKFRIKKVEIHGHTDIIPLGPAWSRKYYSNWGLSAMRAVKVAHIFVDECGMDGGKVLVAGSGKYEPRVYKKYRDYEKFLDDFSKKWSIPRSDEATLLARASRELSKNRRIEIVIYFDERRGLFR